MKLEIFRKLESDEIEFEKSLGLRSGRAKRGKVKKLIARVHVKKFVQFAKNCNDLFFLISFIILILL